MFLKYGLTEMDYVQHLLFTASKFDRTKKRRNWITTTAVIFGIGVIFYLSKVMNKVYYCLVTAVITLIFYP